MEERTGEAPDATARVRLAFAHHLAGRRAEAEDMCRDVLAREPGHAPALHLLAVMAHGQRRFGPALTLARMAVLASPGTAGFQNTLGIILSDAGQPQKAVAAFEAAARLDPAGFEAQRNLAIALSKPGRLDEAVAPLSRAAALQSDNHEIWTLLAALHHGRLDLRAAIDCQRRALALRPADAAAHSDLLVTLHYSSDYSPEQLFAEHLDWARRHEEPILARHPERPFENNRDADRPLRVGYLSGDFREHPHCAVLLSAAGGTRPQAGRRLLLQRRAPPRRADGAVAGAGGCLAGRFDDGR